MTAVYLTSDLFFSASVTSHARELGVAVRIVADEPSCVQAAEVTGSPLVLIDLSQRGVDVGRLVGQLKRLSPPPRVVAYGSHVQEALLAAAKTAGCDEVLPRSQFDRQMRRILSGGE